MEDVISEPLQSAFILWIPKELQIEKGWVEEDFPEVALVVDATVQQIPKPAVHSKKPNNGSVANTTSIV
jgi:hypothetical protein